MLYSFDVFDTVITRKTATPQGIWKMMQRELLRERAYADIPEYVRKNFYDLRIRIERLVRVILFVERKSLLTGHCGTGQNLLYCKKNA